MDKEEEPQQIQFNKEGRPKQKVIFYELTEEMKDLALEKLKKQESEITQEKYQQAKNQTKKVWDKFYKFHKCNFFKDRTYLERQINPITFFKDLYNEKKIVSNFVELGCGVGNTIFPLLRDYPCFNYYGFDISAKAIHLIQQQMEKHEEYKDRLHVSVCDLVKDPIPYEQTGDLSTLIFVLSAIVPEQHLNVMQKIYDWMKPGTFFYFRDYGRYDFGQLNLASKGNRKVKQNFYMKNDGVCVYYFEKEELEKLCEKVGFKKIKVHLLCKLLENRKRGLKMYRVWLQGQFYKPPISEYFENKIIEMQKFQQKTEEVEVQIKQEEEFEVQQEQVKKEQKNE